MEQEKKTAPVAETQERLTKLLTQRFRVGDIRVMPDALHKNVQEQDQAFLRRSNVDSGRFSILRYLVRK